MHVYNSRRMTTSYTYLREHTYYIDKNWRLPICAKKRVYDQSQKLFNVIRLLIADTKNDCDKYVCGKENTNLFYFVYNRNETESLKNYL